MQDHSLCLERNSPVFEAVVSINSTSEEVLRLVEALSELKLNAVSINSTSEEVLRREEV